MSKRKPVQLNIKLDLSNEQIQRQLLLGLDHWVKLGLLSESQIKEIATKLSTVRPSTVRPIDKTPIDKIPIDERQSATASDRIPSNTSTNTEQTERELTNSAALTTVPEETSAHKTSWFSQAIASLIEEISVIWLLFLGVFLVVVSSGVLAASQWNSFTPLGQYGILLTYTLAFWVASLWSQKQENLQNTGRMLALTTLLLIPVNFWVIDRFGILSSAPGIITGLIAAVILTALPLSLSNEFMPRRTNRLNLIGLSWLHLGWSSEWTLTSALGWPLLATYLGTISTAANLTIQDRQLSSANTESANPATKQSESSKEESAEESPETDPETPSLPFDLLTVALSILILLFRSLFVAQVSISQLGLAAGICGWLLVWITRNKANSKNWELAGFSLLALGWLVSFTESPPLQAIAISLLTLNLLWSKFQQTWHQLYLLIGLGVGLQTYGLIWSVVPTTFRDRLLTWLSTWFNVGPVKPINWAGIGLFPYLLSMLVLAAYLRKQPQNSTTQTAEIESDPSKTLPTLSLSQLTELLALTLGFGLALLSASNLFTSAINLTLSTLTLLFILIRKQAQSPLLLALTHSVFFFTLFSWISYFTSGLSPATWGSILLGSAIAELIAHLILYKPQLPNNLLQLNTWIGGLILSILSYSLLLEDYGLSASVKHHWLLWLAVPITLTLIANSRRAQYPKTAARLTLAALCLQLPWLTTWPISITTFATATLCLGLNSRIWRTRLSVLATVAAALLTTYSLIWYGLLRHLNDPSSRPLILWTIAIWSLWLIQRGLIKRFNRKISEMALLYIYATRTWAAILMALYLLWATCIAIVAALDPDINAQEATFTRYVIAATCILIAALIEFIRYRPIEWRYWSLAWAAELALVTSLILQGANAAELGIATLVLAFLTEVTADLWILKQRILKQQEAANRHPETTESPTYRNSWQSIPLILSALGLCLGHLEFQATTGVFTLAAGLLLIGIGRRDHHTQPPLQLFVDPAFTLPLKLFSYLGLIAFTIGTYELLGYKLSQASSGGTGDGITLLALLALVFTYLYKLLQPQIAKASKTSTTTIEFISQSHWALGSVLCLFAANEGLSQPKGFALWTLCSLSLAAYALLTGNRRYTPQTTLNHTLWTWIGLISILGCITYSRYLWFPDRTTLFVWGGLIACAISILFYYISWENLSWPSTPWRTVGLWLPLLTITITLSFVTTQTLLIVAAFYAWMAKQINRIRLSYLSIILLDFALLDYLSYRDWITVTTLSLTTGFSLLYFAEVEPALRNNRRAQKHWVRTLASGLVGLCTLYQTEISESLLLFAAITCTLAILFIFAGLILKVRAFLYVGTITFIVQVLRVLWLFISANSLLLWAVGIVLGLLFIWVAATFESRRSQLSTRLSTWTNALESWE